MRHGVEKWAEVGTERNPGTMIFTLSGHVQRVGASSSLRHDRAATPTRSAAAVRPRATASRRCSPAARCSASCPDFALDLGDRAGGVPREQGAVGLGGGGFVFLDDTRLRPRPLRPVRVVHRGRVLRPLHHLSRRHPAHVEIIRRIQRGGGRESDLGKLRLLADTLRYSNCFHGQAAPAIVDQRCRLVRRGDRGAHLPAPLPRQGLLRPRPLRSRPRRRSPARRLRRCGRARQRPLPARRHGRDGRRLPRLRRLPRAAAGRRAQGRPLRARHRPRAGADLPAARRALDGYSLRGFHRRGAIRRKRLRALGGG